jgi:hypothetical protein
VSTYKQPRYIDTEIRLLQSNVSQYGSEEEDKEEDEEEEEAIVR